MPPEIRAIGIEGLPEVRAGDDLAAQIMDACAAQGTPLENGDVLVVTQKVVSKAEGRVMTIDDVEASPLAVAITEGHRRDPRHTEMILRESRRIVRMDRGVIISETYHGYICANAGIDASNIPGENAICLLPVDPDASAQGIRDAVSSRLGVDVAVLVSDTFGRPWRNGAVNVSIGVAGFNPVVSYIGEFDPHGNELHTTTIAVADELAATAELVTGKLLGVPVAIIRGYPYEHMDDASSRAIVREGDKDLFR
ncbi:Bifunctional F420 biosynthesis protein FbiB [Geodia barretti]|uniref:Bifunctional F420 biosynthesis protein FbiB n=1 Tax=Geodia barretti TaxID=519541 RepID=A0AA35T9R1_GEOBA|nr:Bifunctional F420 biosynthesis protein FbiB [Geodia barretti]